MSTSIITSKDKRHCVIYIPGLGDQRTQGQMLALRLWRRPGLYVEMFVMHWYDSEPYQDKFERLLKVVDRHLEAGETVSLVGASAGASVALNAFADRQEKVNGLVGLCGKF